MDNAHTRCRCILGKLVRWQYRAKPASSQFEFICLHSKTKGYSGNEYDINGAIKNNILYPSLDPSIFEVKYPNADIKGKAVKP